MTPRNPGWRRATGPDATGGSHGWTRRAVMAASGAVAAIPVAAMSGAAVARSARTMRFGLTPVFLDSDTELLAALQGYLSSVLSRPVQLIQRRTYKEILSLLLSEQIDAAWICGYPYVQYRDRLDLVAVPVYQGEPLYRSYVITDGDQNVDGLEGLRGGVHAFSDPDSNSGYLVTRFMLAQRGEAPGTFFETSFFTYGHRNVIRAVAAGLAGSGSVDGYVWDVVNQIEPSLAGRTRVLNRSPAFGFPPIACNRAASRAGIGDALRAALLAMGNAPAGRDVLSTLRLDGFMAPDPSLFAGIADMVTTLERPT